MRSDESATICISIMSGKDKQLDLNKGRVQTRHRRLLANGMPGFINIRTLAIVILVLVILGLLGVSVEHDIVEDPGVQENTSYVWEGVTHVWQTYLTRPLDFIWNEVIVGILWEGFRINMERLQNGQSPTDFSSMDTSSIPSIPDLISEYNQNN